jgi:peptidyl-prolyl cis-trans isomerase B (cyclophilin B)
MLKILTAIIFCLSLFVVLANGQKDLKKNTRAVTNKPKTAPLEPFEKATVEAMASQCVRLETESGQIELEMFPESAPETVRNFLNLVSLGAYNTTTFSRVVPDFVVQGGNVSTRETITQALADRANRKIADEPSQIKHQREILSMARPSEPNSASSHFFILVSDAPHLDGTFAAFGRVTKGMEVVDAINKMPVTGDKPTKPVRLTRAAVFACVKKTEP